MNYKIVFFGTKHTTVKMIDYLFQIGKTVDLVISVDEEVTRKNDIAGYQPLDQVCEKYNIELYKACDYSLQDERTIAFFAENNFELGISMGWQRIIPKSILESFSYGIFGFHGSCGYLPYGRGRSPLNWSLVNGDTRFILNLFQYDEKPDSPNVYKREMFEINEYDNISTIQYKNLLVAEHLLEELIDDYICGSITISKKSKDFSTWYVKRTPNDGKINFYEKTRNIYNLVRGVTHPFSGAFAYIGESKIIIWKVYPFDQIMDFSLYAPGEIISIFDGNVIVRTIDGSIIITEYECEKILKIGDVLR